MSIRPYAGYVPGGTLLYLSYGYVPSQRVGFLRRFQGLKTGIDFAYLGLNSGMLFEGMYERICRNMQIRGGF